MPDIFLAWNNATGTADWSATGTDLETAIILSVFTDAAAAPDVVPPDGDPRGWWATAYSGTEIGSQLWQLERGVVSAATLAQAIGTAQASLQWLIDNNVAASVTVTGQWQGAMLALAVAVTEPDGTVKQFNYGWAWDAVLAGSAVPDAGSTGALFELDVSSLDEDIIG